ncbi:MAG: OmpA family protein [Myxococcota bacterium]
MRLGFWVSASVLCSVFLVGSARAQSGTALNQFDPAPVGDRAFGVQSPDVRGHNRLRASLLFDYAHDPLVLSSGDREVGAVVGDQLFLRLGASYALYQRLLLSLEVPVALVQAGDDPSDAASGLSAASPDSAEFGDVRLGARVRLLGPEGPGMHLSAGTHVWLPTGASGSYVSDEGVRGAPFLVFGGYEDRISWSVQGGMMFRPGKTLPGSTATPTGTAITFGAAFGYMLDEARTFQIGPELYGLTTVAQGGSVFGEHSTNAELLAAARFRPKQGPWLFGLGAGPGIGRGAGTPDYRVVAMVAFSPESEPTPEAPADTDRDGVLDRDDACPNQAGSPSSDPKLNGCPAVAPDRDHDGVSDSVDMCPDLAGIGSSDPKKNGCPPDRDNDGVIDSEDVCPDVAGLKTGDPKTNGCPSDSDGDGIVDAEDACPALAGVKTSDPKTNGCPADRDKDGVPDAEDACPDLAGVKQPAPHNGCPLARLIKEESLIAITQQVQFDHGKATIKPESDELLNNVVKVLKEFPEIEQLEIQGHTDNTGPAYINRKLSADRAHAVLDWLVSHGVEAKRLTSRGYGPDKPVDNNATEAGRAKNRRVVFRVLRGPGFSGKDNRK